MSILNLAIPNGRDHQCVSSSEFFFTQTILGQWDLIATKFLNSQLVIATSVWTRHSSLRLGGARQIPAT